MAEVVADFTNASKRPRLEASGEERGRRLHPVWEYFAVLDNNSMECLECGRTFKTTGSTTVCKHHLRSRHPNIFAQLAAEETKDWRTKAVCTGSDGDAVDEAAMKRFWHMISKTGDIFDDEKLLVIECVRDRPLIWSASSCGGGENGGGSPSPAAVGAEFADIAQHISSKLKDYSAQDVQHIWESLKEAYKCAKVAAGATDDFDAAEEDDEQSAEQKRKFLNAMSFMDTVLTTVAAESRPVKQQKKRAKPQKPTMVHEFEITNQSLLAAAQFGCSDGNNNNGNGDLMDYDLKLFQPTADLDYLKRQFSTAPAGAPFTAHGANNGGCTPAMDVFASLLKQTSHQQQPQQQPSLTQLTTMAVGSGGGGNGVSSSLLDLDETRDESSPLGSLVVDLHRKLRQRNKLYKAMEFKKTVFNLISEYEAELL